MATIPQHVLTEVSATVDSDREALAAMRAVPEPPAAPWLFRSVGADPSLEILVVEAELDR